jgi:hypothetical protein
MKTKDMRPYPTLRRAAADDCMKSPFQPQARSTCGKEADFSGAPLVKVGTIKKPAVMAGWRKQFLLVVE